MIEDELEPLITCCPNCGTRFRVTENQLAVAAGRVRCGACLTVFEGTSHLVLDDEDQFASEREADAALDELLDELGGIPARPFAPGDSAADSAAEAVGGLDELAPARLYGGHEDDIDRLTAAMMAQATESLDAGFTGREPGAHGDDHDQAGSGRSAEEGVPAEAALAESVPLESVSLEAAESAGEASATSAAAADAMELAGAHPGAAPAADAQVARDETEAELLGTQMPVDFSPEPRRWWVGAVAVGFVLALVGQILFFQFPVWSKDPGIRPLYGSLCGVLGCELPDMRDLSALSTRNLIVRSHPDLEGALVVDAVVVNEAEFVQPFPDLELRFTAVDGMLVAGRRFAPGEYLKGDETDPEAMPPRTPVQVSLEIEDPGPSAVNYMLRFR